MNPTKRNLFFIIIVNLILGLVVLAVPMRIWHSQQNTLKETATRENKLENELTQSIKNFTELEELYNELQARNDRLEWLTKEQGWQEFTCTGYSANDGEQGTNGITATGFKTDCGLPIIAVDPDVIPKFSMVEIEGLGGYIALDVGRKIIGNRIDILFDSKEEALEFGKQELMVRVIR